MSTEYVFICHQLVDEISFSYLCKRYNILQFKANMDNAVHALGSND